MNGPDLVPILRSKGVTQLFHADTVSTSAMFIRVGGLASRGYAEQLSLAQTPQGSDASDRRFGVWDDVFLDTADIHSRIGNLNYYGPVSFSFDLELLNHLPPGSEVRITKNNPTKWLDQEPVSDRLFATPAEVEADLMKGRFDQMIMVRAPALWLPFPAHPVSIVLDDPRQKLPNGASAFEQAVEILNDASRKCGLQIKVIQRACSEGCKCSQSYARSGAIRHSFDLFLPPS